MSPKKLAPQTKAVLLITPSGNVLLRTDDGRAVVLAPTLAADVARKILDESQPRTATLPRKRWLQ